MNLLKRYEGNKMKAALLKKIEKIGWGFIIFLTLLGIAGSSGHILDGFFAIGDNDQVVTVNIALYGKEFFEHWLNFRTYPWARMLHMLPGFFVILFMPLQFVSSFRAGFPKLHRINGYLIIIGTLFLIPTGFIFAFQHPYVGFAEQVPTVFYASIYFGCLAMALKSVYQKNYLAHREWMIRVFAMAQGIYSIRVWYSLFFHLTNLSSLEFFATSFWIGIAFNLIVGEIWINVSRKNFAKAANQNFAGRFPETGAANPSVTVDEAA